MSFARSALLLAATLAVGSFAFADLAAAQARKPAPRTVTVKRQTYAVPGNVVPVGRENRYVTDSTSRPNAYDATVQGLRTDPLFFRN